MTDALTKLADRINRLDERFKGEKYVAYYLVPVDLAREVRDEIEGGKGRGNYLNVN